MRACKSLEGTQVPWEDLPQWTTIGTPTRLNRDHHRAHGPIGSLGGDEPGQGEGRLGISLGGDEPG